MDQDLEAGVIALFAEHADKSGEPITVDTPLESLGIHSLELTEIVMDIEDKYGIEIDLSTVDSWTSFSKVGDLVDVVRRLNAEKSAS